MGHNRVKLMGCATQRASVVSMPFGVLHLKDMSCYLCAESPATASARNPPASPLRSLSAQTVPRKKDYPHFSAEALPDAGECWQEIGYCHPGVDGPASKLSTKAVGGFCRTATAEVCDNSGSSVLLGGAVSDVLNAFGIDDRQEFCSVQETSSCTSADRTREHSIPCKAGKKTVGCVKGRFLRAGTTHQYLVFNDAAFGQYVDQCPEPSCPSLPLAPPSTPAASGSTALGATTPDSWTSGFRLRVGAALSTIVLVTIQVFG